MKDKTKTEYKDIVYNQDLPTIEIAKTKLAPNGTELEREFYSVKGRTLKECESSLKRIRK